MPTIQSPVSDMVVTVKSREVQRAMLAEMRGDSDATRRHFLAAAHLELVLADDYDQAADAESALRGRLSAGSCFWRAGDQHRAKQLLAALAEAHPHRAAEIQSVLDDLSTLTG